jgi:hypothetical protein
VGSGSSKVASSSGRSYYSSFINWEIKEGKEQEEAILGVGRELQ